MFDFSVGKGVQKNVIGKNSSDIVGAKGQLISKQDCRAITSPKKQTLGFYF